jgi:hypothetical protein
VKSVATPRELAILQRVEDLIDFDPFVSSDPLKERLQQSLTKFVLDGDRDSLKPGHHRLQANMVSDLSDKMIVPMPAKACDRAVRR